MLTFFLVWFLSGLVYDFACFLFLLFHVLRSWVVLLAIIGSGIILECVVWVVVERCWCNCVWGFLILTSMACGGWLV